LGCEKHDKYEEEWEVYENHEISACGIDDPLTNLDWLKEFTEKNRDPMTGTRSNISIELYGNIETQEEYIVIIYSLARPLPDGYARPRDTEQVYTCSGERVELGYEEWNDFFGYYPKNESQGIIWYRKKIK